MNGTGRKRSFHVLASVEQSSVSLQFTFCIEQEWRAVRQMSTIFGFLFLITAEENKIRKLEGKHHIVYTETLYIRYAWSKIFENSKTAGVHFIE